MILSRYLSAFLLFFLMSVSHAQTLAGSPWFGLQAPSGIGDPHAPTVDVSRAQGRPVRIPAGEEDYRELEGERLFSYLDTIVGFSRESRAEGNRVWGRVNGFPSARRTMEWVASQFSDAGLQQVEVQDYAADAGMWWAHDWELRLLGNPAFGPRSQDIVLETSLPTGGSELDDGPIVASLILTGHITDPLPEADLQGKVAVQRLTPLTGAYSERTPTRERAQQLIAAGAVGVINIVEQLGNMHTRDFSNCNGPCFNIGTEDGDFLEAVVARSQAQGLSEELKVQLSLDAEVLEDLRGQNAMGIVPGKQGLAGEVVIVNAHADGWYDGAGDNGDGLSVLIAMARHFAKAENQPERAIVFVASGGHHSRGLNGPANFVRMNPGILERTVLVLNLEHVAQFEIDSSDWSVGPAEQPMNFSITNSAPYLIELTRNAMQRYGFNIRSEFRTNAPGDLGGYRPLGLPMVQAIHSGPMYHASGDVRDTISVPGMERAARFFTYFIGQVSAAEKDLLDP